MVLTDYILWHYTVAPGSILEILHNYLIGTWYRFLIRRHLHTLFAPWHRMSPSSLGGSASIGNRMGDWITDIYLRLLAALIRLSIIVAGLLVELITILCFTALLILWLLWPLILIFSIFKSLTFLI